MRSWIGCLIGAAICVLIALVLAPFVPDPGGHIITIIAWFGAVILAVLAIYYLVTGNGTRTPL